MGSTGYKVLGFVVWQGARIFLGRHTRIPSKRVLAAVAGGVVAVGGAIALAIASSGDD